ncbi:hypothetical protein XENORESO_003590 [Xenotaenia resolanae]|uniref:Uncharacterized protein n=1 Tax=Xenotaenia resolanae TaxID=208358 RepID=A0ABV0W0T4_9TELE
MTVGQSVSTGWTCILIGIPACHLRRLPQSQPREPGTVPAVLLHFLQVPPSREEATGAISSLLEGEFTIAGQCSLEEALDIFNAGQESDNFTFATVTDNTTAPLLRTEDTETGASQPYLN